MSTSQNSLNTSIQKALEPKAKKLPLYVPTGCTVLDLVVGGFPGAFGFPFGRVVNYVGDKSSGKTFLAIETIVAAYYKFGPKRLRWIYDDAEEGFSFDTKEMYGISIMPEDEDERIRSRTVEEAFCNVTNFANSLKPQELGIYVIDSMDGLSSEEGDKLAEGRLKAFNEGKEFKQGSYKMGAAKYLSQEFFKQLVGELADKNILLIIVSQVRENIDSFSFDKYVRAGGKAMDFYCHTVLWLANVGKIKRRERSVGVVVKAKTTKSKTPRPYRECIFTLMFDYGIDDIGSGLDFLYDLRGESFELLAKANKIVWDPGEKPSAATIKDFFATNASAMKAYTEATGRTKILYAEAAKWLDTDDKIPADVMSAYSARFGASMKREDLIRYIEQDDDRRKELRRRVVEKYEELEDSIRSNRVRKYGGVFDAR